ncbi:hypothetical protein DFJ43DRAFT_1133695 [Lentinula guzmanii]|uniref:Uncharacterized protein n=3 Tax=Lentinula TaxID=5352 RepID=A0AA38JKG9_9AGAR|nr:hypothetical protein DFJ43DRAFT_1133695 [Lentinula guzmanii]KAJ3742098.1 hypothetical protein DFH05DRAFT_282279 [Lentinula detonsa]KAJ3788595.1 hypothetical protein GGU10DRAFT_105588 [Lentinula aff. detonsa]KAJ3990009.1 hypothetical protein F5890DRAFT_870878 [Lentinula detonsa]
MAGPNLEVFKFSLYLFIPICALVHFGDPQWYRNTVLPYKEQLFPPEKRLLQQLPTDQSSLREELARIKSERLARRLAREEENKS